MVPEPQPDLAFRCLQRQDLSGRDLRSANLTGADLTDASLAGANLAGASLRMAKLVRADLSHANAAGACFDRADLSFARLRGADLRGATFDGAVLRGAQLVGTTPDAGALAGADLVGAALADGDIDVFTDAAANCAMDIVEVSPDGALVATTGRVPPVVLWDMSTGAPIRVLHGQSGRIDDLVFSPDGATLAAASPRSIVVWDVSTGAVRWRNAEDPSFEGDPSRPATTRAADALVNLQNVVLCAAISWLDTVLAFSDDGAILAIKGGKGRVTYWDAATGAARGAVAARWRARRARGIAWSPDEATIVVSSGATMTFRDAGSLAIRRDIPYRSGRYLGRVAVSADGTTLATACADGSVLLWDAGTCAVRHRLRGPHDDVTYNVTSLAFRPSQTLTVGYRSTVGYEALMRWDVATGAALRTLLGASTIGRLYFNPESEILASWSKEHNAVTLRDVMTGADVGVLPSHIGHERAHLAVSQDGTVLAAGGSEIVVWDLSTGDVRARVSGPHRVTALAMSPDCAMLASGNDGGTIAIWDVARSALLRVLPGHLYGIDRVTFWLGGGALASSGRDGTVRLWDVATGDCLASLFAGPLGWAAATPDGRYKLSGDLSGVFWHAIGLCRFEPGELDPYVPLRVSHDAALFSLPGAAEDSPGGPAPRARPAG